jgi:flagellar biosynthesis protein FlhF
MGGVRVTAAVEERPVTPSPNFTTSFDEGFDADSVELISDALIQHHVPSVLAEKLLGTATQYAHEDTLLALGAALDTHMLYAPFEDRTTNAFILVGPPGAGKTLCTAKLATHSVLNKQKTALISTDTERAGGMAQLSAFAKILNTDILEIEDPAALQDAVAIQSAETMTFVDTAGCNPFSKTDQQNLKNLIRNVNAELCLVLPADMDADIALEMARTFAELGAKRMVATRLDMTRRIGGILKASYESGLPLAAFSATNKVTEQLSPFNPVSLARLFLPKEEHDKTTAARATIG